MFRFFSIQYSVDDWGAQEESGGAQEESVGAFPPSPPVRPGPASDSFPNWAL